MNSIRYTVKRTQARVILALSLLSLVMPTEGQCGLITWKFEATVISDNYGGNVDLGDIVTGSFSYHDDGAGQINPAPIGSNISALIDGDAFSLTADAKSAAISRLLFYDGMFLNPGQEPDEFVLDIINQDGTVRFRTLGFQNVDGTIFSGDSHNQSLIPLSLWDSPTLVYNDPTGSWQASLTSLSAVPEPSSLALVAFSALGVVGVRWRRSKRQVAKVCSELFARRQFFDPQCP